jgi:hypothetical protein
MSVKHTQQRPVCINHGCNQPVTYSNLSQQGIPRYRVHCSHCQGASYGRHAHKFGVTPYRTGRCSNHDGHLGFPCATDFELIPNWAKGTTEVDHKDGDRNNNAPNNLQELCKICHRIKGQVNKDFARRRSLTHTAIVLYS